MKGMRICLKVFLSKFEFLQKTKKNNKFRRFKKKDKKMVPTQ